MAPLTVMLEKCTVLRIYQASLPALFMTKTRAIPSSFQCILANTGYKIRLITLIFFSYTNLIFDMCVCIMRVTYMQ